MVAHDVVSAVCEHGKMTTVDGGTKHLGDTAKVSVVGGHVATSGLTSVGMDEVFGEMTTHEGCCPKIHCGTGSSGVTDLIYGLVDCHP